jgi:hypothetical protein
VVFQLLQDATEEYDGTTWDSVILINTARDRLAGCRYSNSSFSIWWSRITPSGATEEYDGQLGHLNPTGLNTARSDLAGVELKPQL